jgi:hypothetical protein
MELSSFTIAGTSSKSDAGKLDMVLDLLGIGRRRESRLEELFSTGPG